MEVLNWILAGLAAFFVQCVGRLMDIRGAAVLRDSVLFSNYDVKKQVQDARDRNGRVIEMHFSVTIVSPSTVADTYNLLTIPKGWSVAGLHCTTDGLGGTTTVSIGDAGSAVRFALATSLAAAEAQLALAFAGVAFRPTADTIVVATIGSTAATVGKIFKGHMRLIPGS